ncbi:MAG TPA: VTT domain-containing protein [Anaeromyxobacter sp.]|nr:VTT domain-containing protein [Anaeromyxobacter sp.]
MAFPGEMSSTLKVSSRSRRRFWLRLLALAVLLAVAQLLHPQQILGHAVEQAREAGWAGRVVFGALYVPAALLGVPMAVLTFTGGVIFGPLAAFLLAMPGCTVGSCAAFLVGRVTAGDPGLLARGEGRVARFARRLEERRGGFSTVVLLRLAPVTPFAVLNFAFGATPMSLSTYALATLVGSVPANLGFALAGAFLGHRG